MYRARTGQELEEEPLVIGAEEAAVPEAGERVVLGEGPRAGKNPSPLL